MIKPDIYKILAFGLLIIAVPVICIAASKYDIADIFTKMRNMAFDVEPAELDIKQESPGLIYGVFMETGLDDAAYSLRCFKEGSISIYFTNGGGIIGIGEHENARNKGLDLISFSEKYVKYAKKTKTRDLPSPGETYFYFLSFDGIYFLSAKTNEIEKGKHLYFPLYMKAQEVLTEARIIDESRN